MSNVDYNYESVKNLSGGTATLDRTSSVSKIKSDDELQKANEKMHENLNRLLHYDLYERQEKERQEAEELKKSQAVDVATIEEPVEAEKIETSPVAESIVEIDIKPTSTTMQFGDGDVQKTYQEDMKKGEVKNSEKLSKKGKILVFCYAAVVAIVLSLIILNTGILARISQNYQEKTAELSQLMSQNSEYTQQIEDISNDDYISDIAKNQLNMKLR